MNNLEKAELKLKEFEFDISIPDKFYAASFDAIELAATPNWKYPENNEFPKHLERILVVTKCIAPSCIELSFDKKENYFFSEDNYNHITKTEISEIIAWCKLPTFNKNEMEQKLKELDNEMDDFVKRIKLEYNQKVEKNILKNLIKFGFYFCSKEEFYTFCKNRIKKISFDEKQNYYELYLDFVDGDNRGKFIGSYSDRIEIINNGNEASLKIG